MKFLPAFAFCAVLISVRAELAQFGSLDTMIYDPDTAKISKCYDIMCPTGTAGCSKVKKTSEDMESITTTYKCEDENGGVLHSERETVQNPYPGVSMESFSFSGVYHVTNGVVGGNRTPFGSFGNRNPVTEDNDRFNHERNKYHSNDLDSQVETFDR